MFKWILEHLKIIAIISLIIVAWVGFSIAINVFIPWDKLTSLFVIIRWVIGKMDWIVDSTQVLWAVGLTLTLTGLEWALFAGIMPISWFRGKKQ